MPIGSISPRPRRCGRLQIEDVPFADIPHRKNIEEFLEEEPSDKLHFCYAGLPPWLTPLLQIQGGHQFYYHLWQIWACKKTIGNCCGL